MRISVVIPAYNEATCVASTIKEVYAFFSQKNFFLIEVLVVDDCSTDETGLIIQGLSVVFPDLHYLRNEENRGKGYSVKRGVLASTGDYILFMDADFSTPINQFSVLWEAAAVNPIVIGSRALKNSVIVRHQFWFKEYVARLGNKVIRMLLGLPFYDTQCGFKLFSKTVKGIFEVQTINRWGFDMELLFIAKKNGYTIAEVPVRWTNDPTSLVKKIDYLIVLLDIFKILINDILGRYNSVVSGKN